MNKKENKVKKFVKEHKKGIFITFGILGGLVLCFFGGKFVLTRPSIDKFLKKSSLDVLKDKRDEIHTEYLNYTKNDNYREGLTKLINVLDVEIRKRECDGKPVTGRAYYREHGYNLYKPD